MKKTTEHLLTFVGAIEKVVADRAANGNQPHSKRIYVKMVSYDENLNEMSVYFRVQGQKAQMVLDVMDEFGNVEGLWMAKLHPSVVEYPGTDHTIYANLIHCAELELLDDVIEVHFPEFPPAKPEPMKFPGKSTGIMNWVKTVFA